MESTDDPFLKAWETRQESPSPTVPSNPPEDPWGTVKEDTGRVSIQGNSESTVNSISGELTFDNVFQQCNNFTESAIPNKNNNSHARDTRNSGFDDDFGAWSETDVLFKSGLLDQEFKTVSVTAEEDDLWSSADLSSLNLSLQSQSFVPHDEAERQEEVVSTRRRAFQNPDVIVTSEVGNDDEGINGSGVAFSSKSKLSKETLNQDFVKTGCEPEVDPNLSGSSNITLHNSFGDREGKINANTTVGSAHAVIHSNDIEATAGVPETVDTKGLRVTRPTETVKTSINYTGNVNASSGDATDRSLSHSASSGKDSTSARDTSNAHPRENIPSIVVNSTSGTFLSKTDKIKMGNILDSDNEEPEKMEGEVAITEDTGGEMPPPETGQVNGENSTPSIDQKETVVLHDEGTEVMVNGDGEEDGDGDSVNVSLDTETQTREDDFPPDEEYPAEPLMMGEAATKEEGLKDGQLPVSQELIQKDIDIDEDKNNEDNQEDEKEDSSEGYGSQDADKALESEENGVEDHVKDSEGDTQKKQEVALSQDEGLSSPQTEESKVTLPCNEETGLRPVVLRDLDSAPEQEDESSEGRPKSYVKTAVKMREKTSRVNSHVVRQNRISFVEQEVLRHKQQEEDFRREREMRTQELMQQGKSTSPSSPSPPNSTGNSRLQSPTSPEPPAAKPVKAPSKPTTSKAKAVYQELKYNPKTGGGNRSTAMVKEWESKFKK